MLAFGSWRRTRQAPILRGSINLRPDVEKSLFAKSTDWRRVRIDPQPAESLTFDMVLRRTLGTLSATCICMQITCSVWKFCVFGWQVVARQERNLQHPSTGTNQTLILHQNTNSVRRFVGISLASPCMRQLLTVSRQPYCHVHSLLRWRALRSNVRHTVRPCRKRFHWHQ